MTDHLSLIALRGALLGFCHLSVWEMTLCFLENEIDPFGTKAANVDSKTRQFLSYEVPSEDLLQGKKLLQKLALIGYFDQNAAKDLVDATQQKY